MKKRIQGLVFFRGSQMLEIEKQINEWISTVLNPKQWKNTEYELSYTTICQHSLYNFDI
jgi:hypothetical protein